MDVILGKSLSDRILDFSAYKSYMIATVFLSQGFFNKTNFSSFIQYFCSLNNFYFSFNKLDFDYSTLWIEDIVSSPWLHLLRW